MQTQQCHRPAFFQRVTTDHGKLTGDTRRVLGGRFSVAFSLALVVGVYSGCTTEEDGHPHPTENGALVLPSTDAQAGTLQTGTGSIVNPETPTNIAELRKTPEYQNCDEAQAATNNGFFGPNLLVELADVVVTAPRFVLYEHPTNPAKNLYGYFIADPGGGPDSGIVLSLDATKTTLYPVGTHLAISGEATSYFCMTQLRGAAVTELEDNTAFATPVDVTPEILADPTSGETYEGALVRVLGVTVTEKANKFGEFQVDQSLFVGDLYPYQPPSVGQVVNITGVMNYSFGKRLLEPRSDEDIDSLGSE